MGNGCLPQDNGAQVVICLFFGAFLSSWNCPPYWLPLALNLSSLHLTAWGLLFRIWCLPFHPLLSSPLQLYKKYNLLQVDCTSDTWHGLVNTGYTQFTCACTAWKTLVNKPSMCWCTSPKVLLFFSLTTSFLCYSEKCFLVHSGSQIKDHTLCFHWAELPSTSQITF